MGPVEDDASIVYLRPETAQGSYVNFKNVQQTLAQEDPVRDRPDRQVVPQRDQPGQLRLPDARVRADGDAVLRPPGRGRRRSSRSGCRAAGTGTSATASRPSGCASASTPRTSWPTTRRRRSTSSTASRSAGRSSRAIHNRGDFDLSRHAEASGENLEYFDPATEEHFIPWIVETAAGAGPGGVHVPHRRLPRGGGPRRDARLARAPPGPRAVQGRGPAAAQEAARDRRAVPPDQGRPASAT